MGQVAEPRPPRRGRLGLLEAGFLAAASILVLVGLAAFLVPLIPLPIEAARMPVRDLGGGARAVRVNGFDLWYREVGPRNGKPVVVVIHGGPGMSDRYFGKVFDFLAKDYRVVYYDQRGSGFSEIKRDPRSYRFRYLVDDLETLRRSVIRSDKLILAAHSFGGLIAMRYAVQHPEHVAGLILISSMPPRDWGSPIGAAHVRLDDSLMSLDPASRDRVYLQSYLNSIGDSLYDPKSGIVPDIGYLSYVPARFFWDTAAGYDYTQALSRLRVPALIIYGVSDILDDSVPAALHEVLEGSTLVRFDRSGHWAFLEEPGRFKAVVGEFLGVALTSRRAPTR